MKPTKSIATCQPKPAAGLVKVDLGIHTENNPAADADDPYVSFTIQIKRSTYFAIHQAKYWTPGFGEIRGHVDRALKSYMAKLPGSNKPLPEEERAKNKKLRS